MVQNKKKVIRPQADNCGCDVKPDKSVAVPSLTGGNYWEVPIVDFKQVPLWFTATGPNAIALNTKIFFDQDSDINQLTISQLSVFTQSDQRAYIGNGLAFDLFTQTQHAQITISIKQRNSDEFYLLDYPIVLLSPTVRKGKPFLTKWDVDLGNSYITLNAIAGLAAAKCLLFNFYTNRPNG